MILYLAELTGESAYNIVEKQYNPQRIAEYYKYDFYLDGKNLGLLVRIKIKGDITILTHNISYAPDYLPCGQYPMDTKFDKVVRTTLRPHTDFDYPVKMLKPYKYCKGGGWYSMVDHFEVNDRTFIKI